MGSNPIAANIGLQPDQSGAFKPLISGFQVENRDFNERSHESSADIDFNGHDPGEKGAKTSKSRFQPTDLA